MNKRIVGLILCLIASVTAVRAQETLYVATGSKGANGVLYTVDPATAAFTMVAPLVTNTGAIGLTGLAFSPLTNVLYGVTGLESPTSPRTLVTIDPVTGAATVIGTLTNNFGTTGIADISFASDGTLYGLSVGGDLYTINLGTAALTTIGDTGGGTPGGGIAFDSDDGLTSAGPATGTVDDISTVDGARTTGPTMTGAPHAGTLGAMMALAYNSSDVLYAANSAREQNGATVTTVNLVTINTLTGAVTNIGSLPGNVDALAFGPAIPEPSTLGLLGAGAILVALWRRKRR